MILWLTVLIRNRTLLIIQIITKNAAMFCISCTAGRFSRLEKIYRVPTSTKRREIHWEQVAKLMKVNRFGGNITKVREL